jgi:hypothetical protein
MNRMSPAHARAVDLDTVAERSITAKLGFTVPQDEKPVFHSSALTGGAPEIFFQVEEVPVLLADMRPIVGALDLDREGFELVDRDTAVADLYDDDAVTTAYYDEIRALLTERFGASRVAIFDHTRRSDGGAGAANKDGSRGPAARVHVDYTDSSGPKRADDALGAGEVARILAAGGRVVQVNAWRPITGPVRRAPLALADATSIKPDALLATDQVFPDRVGEIYQLAHQEGQRWYWAPEMRREEALLIKGWDTAAGVSKYTPHGAFQIPNQDPAAPPRESIEVRAFVVIEGK